MLYQNGIQEDDVNYTDKDRFGQLEKEYLAFMKFFESKWKETKVKIKKDHLGKKILKEFKEDSNAIDKKDNKDDKE